MRRSSSTASPARSSKGLGPTCTRWAPRCTTCCWAARHCRPPRGHWTTRCRRWQAWRWTAVRLNSWRAWTGCSSPGRPTGRRAWPPCVPAWTAWPRHLSRPGPTPRPTRRTGSAPRSWAGMWHLRQHLPTPATVPTRRRLCTRQSCARCHRRHPRPIRRPRWPCPAARCRPNQPPKKRPPTSWGNPGHPRQPGRRLKPKPHRRSGSSPPPQHRLYPLRRPQPTCRTPARPVPLSPAVPAPSQP